MRLIALDPMRFFAALFVVMYHYTARFGSDSFEYLSIATKFGYLGVPLFFIISGYVITLSAHNRPASEFAVSRFVRLYPAYWAGIAFTSLVTYLYGQDKYTWEQILANLTMLNDYLGYDNIDSVYWTLQAELKFYACIFLLIFFNVFNKVRIWLSIWLALSALHLITNQPFFMGWFITPTYSSLFIAGVTFYLIQKEGLNRFNLVSLFSSLILSSIHAFNQTANFMEHPAFVDKVIAVTLIWFFYIIFYLIVSAKLEVPKHRFYYTLGALTYPLYLIHNASGKIIIDHAEEYMPHSLAVTLTVIVMIFFSYLIFSGIEKKVATPMKHTLLNYLSYFRRGR